MKRTFFYLSAVSMLFITACNDASDNTMTEESDSTNVVTTTTEVPGNSDNSYMDLKTNQPVYISQDSVNHTYINRDTREPLGFYYDPISKDTFDSRGRIINNALVLTNGDYTLNEAKIKSNDDAFKTKYDNLKIKMDENGMKMKDGDMKIKEKDDLYKEKTDSTKLKVKDGEMKVKEK